VNQELNTPVIFCRCGDTTTCTKGFPFPFVSIVETKAMPDLATPSYSGEPRACALHRQPSQAYLPNIADSEVLNDVSHIVLKIDL
jgi:hypothetical protein